MSPELERLLSRGGEGSPPGFGIAEIKCETAYVAMRDGVRLATDIYLPPRLPAPAVVVRTPYNRSKDDTVAALMSLARRGYVAVAQDCRGTGDSEPDSWDYYVFEIEDSYDCVEWVCKQHWCDGFIGSFGGSYVGQTQWCMATHPAMSTIVPLMSGLGVAANTVHLYMFVNAYARAVGKGADKIAVPYYDMERVMEAETMAGGYFNDPLQPEISQALLARWPELRALPPSRGRRWLWKQYCDMNCSERAQFVKNACGVKNVTSVEVESLSNLFGPRVPHDALTIPHVDLTELCRTIQAAPLLRTGWYDWALNDALATWDLIQREARPNVKEVARLIIAPYAHNMTGYREGIEKNSELLRLPSAPNSVGLLMHWYDAVRRHATASWPTVIYYLMGANEWRTASAWPDPRARSTPFYLRDRGTLSTEPPPSQSLPDQYRYDPNHPTPTVGGSIVSYLYPPGGVDVSEVQRRADVLTYTTAVLDRDLDVAGPLRLILYASSSAPDTDFSARLSDVFPDGRAIQLQSGMLRARYRNLDGDPELLQPGEIYRLEIDLWATANRFKAGHRLRLDICSADFPRFDRNANLGGQPGSPGPATQTIHHDAKYPSHLLVPVIERAS